MALLATRKTYSILRITLILLLVCWIVLAAVRTAYNLSKIVTEEKNWVGLNDEEKREKYFGDRYRLVQTLEQNTRSSLRIILQTADGETYYLSRYFLYPTRVYWAKNESDVLRLQKKHSPARVYKTDE